MVMVMLKRVSEKPGKWYIDLSSFARKEVDIKNLSFSRAHYQRGGIQEGSFGSPQIWVRGSFQRDASSQSLITAAVGQHSPPHPQNWCFSQEMEGGVLTHPGWGHVSVGWGGHSVFCIPESKDLSWELLPAWPKPGVKAWVRAEAPGHAKERNFQGSQCLGLNGILQIPATPDKVARKKNPGGICLSAGNIDMWL